jgi:hypothetical protein
MIPSNLTNAQVAGSQLIASFNNIIKQVSGSLANGLPEVPARDTFPGRAAISASDLQAALGSDIVSKFQSIISTAS